MACARPAAEGASEPGNGHRRRGDRGRRARCDAACSRHEPREPARARPAGPSPAATGSARSRGRMHDLRIELRARVVGELDVRLRGGIRLLVPACRGHHVERVGDRDADAARERDVVTSHAIRISVAVVAARDVRSRPGPITEPRCAPERATVASGRDGRGDLPFLGRELLGLVDRNPRGHVELADVVEVTPPGPAQLVPALWRRGPSSRRSGRHTAPLVRECPRVTAIAVADRTDLASDDDQRGRMFAVELRVDRRTSQRARQRFPRSRPSAPPENRDGERCPGTRARAATSRRGGTSAAKSRSIDHIVISRSDQDDDLSTQTIRNRYRRPVHGAGDNLHGRRPPRAPGSRTRDHDRAADDRPRLPRPFRGADTTASALNRRLPKLSSIDSRDRPSSFRRIPDQTTKSGRSVSECRRLALKVAACDVWHRPPSAQPYDGVTTR